MAVARVLSSHPLIDVRWVDKRKRSAFSLAAARGHYQLLRMLVKKGAKGDNQEYWYAVIDLMEQMKENVSFAEEEYRSKKGKTSDDVGDKPNWRNSFKRASAQGSSDVMKTL